MDLREAAQNEIAHNVLLGMVHLYASSEVLLERLVATVQQEDDRSKVGAVSTAASAIRKMSTSVDSIAQSSLLLIEHERVRVETASGADYNLRRAFVDAIGLVSPLLGVESERDFKQVENVQIEPYAAVGLYLLFKHFLRLPEDIILVQNKSTLRIDMIFSEVLSAEESAALFQPLGKDADGKLRVYLPASRQALARVGWSVTISKISPLTISLARL